MPCHPQGASRFGAIATVFVAPPQAAPPAPPPTPPPPPLPAPPLPLATGFPLPPHDATASATDPSTTNRRRVRERADMTPPQGRRPIIVSPFATVLAAGRGAALRSRCGGDDGGHGDRIGGPDGAHADADRAGAGDGNAHQ